MTTTSADPRHRIAAAVVAAAVQDSQYLLHPHTCSVRCGRSCYHATDHPRRIFSACDAVAWLFSRESTVYWEVLELDAYAALRRVYTEDFWQALVQWTQQGPFFCRFFRIEARQWAREHRKVVCPIQVETWAKQQTEYLLSRLLLACSTGRRSE